MHATERIWIQNAQVHSIRHYKWKNYNPLCLFSETTENDFRTTYLTRLVFCFIDTADSFDTTKNEPAKNLQNNLQMFANFANFDNFANHRRGRGSASRSWAPPPPRRGPRSGAGGWARGPQEEWTRRAVANWWQIFGKTSLVFGCIGTDLCM